MIGPYEYMILAAILFTIGVIGVLVRRNVLIVFMSIELMLNSANLVFITVSRVYADMTGHVFVFMVMVVAACEVAVGLAIVLTIFRNRQTVNLDEFRIMKW